MSQATVHRVQADKNAGARREEALWRMFSQLNWRENKQRHALT